MRFSNKKIKRLAQRLKINFTTIPKKRGRKRKIKDKHIDFLCRWFEEDKNVGKPFKYAFNSLQS